MRQALPELLHHLRPQGQLRLEVLLELSQLHALRDVRRGERGAVWVNGRAVRQQSRLIIPTPRKRDPLSCVRGRTRHLVLVRISSPGEETLRPGRGYERVCRAVVLNPQER